MAATLPVGVRYVKCNVAAMAPVRNGNEVEMAGAGPPQKSEAIPLFSQSP
jgi:hypothetical protein